MVKLRVLAFVAVFMACSQTPHAQPSANLSAETSQLWSNPEDLADRDLFLGPGGAAIAPPATGGSFEFLAFKTTGTNPGYDVKDAAGRVWSVKLGIEAQPEVTASRIMWAIGFHQPPQYFVHDFTLNGLDAGVKTNARFRTDPAQWESVGEWSWYENPFMNAPQFRALIVAQLILNNWDLKTANNRVYQATPGTAPGRQYVVRDLGASLGIARQFKLFSMLGAPGAQGTKNDIDGFEEQGFITRVNGAEIEFDYRGMNQTLVNRVTKLDVIWTCELLSQISDTQWQDAFRAGAYSQALADRYIKKIKAKIAQGLALKTPPKN
jgi:hypothetical protein